MGRPEANIDWGLVDSYLLRQCDGVGIAGLLGIHPNTLYERCKEDNNLSFSDYSAQKKGEGKEILRAKQYDTAIGDAKKSIPGNVSMQIWLGKQYLGQKDKSEVDHSITFEPFMELMKKASQTDGNTDDNK